MEGNFNIEAYLLDLGEELVRAYESASMGTTPDAVGSARESSVRARLEQVMPPGVGVGTGFVIDSYGRTSRQIDVVLYEKDLCPVYRLNDQVDYFPCEGVFAVGEIKSQVSSKEIDDIFEKIESVRALRRHAVAEDNLLLGGATVPFRHFGAKTGFEGAPEESYDQDAKISDRIYGFGIGREFVMSPGAVLNRFVERAAAKGDVNTPDALFTANGPTILPWSVDADGSSSAKQVVNAKGFAMVDLGEYALMKLIARLYGFFSSGRTVEIKAYSEYLKSNANTMYTIMDYHSKVNDVR